MPNNRRRYWGIWMPCHEADLVAARLARRHHLRPTAARAAAGRWLAPAEAPLRAHRIARIGTGGGHLPPGLTREALERGGLARFARETTRVQVAEYHWTAAGLALRWAKRTNHVALWRTRQAATNALRRLRQDDPGSPAKICLFGRLPDRSPVLLPPRARAESLPPETAETGDTPDALLEETPS